MHGGEAVLVQPAHVGLVQGVFEVYEPIRTATAASPVVAVVTRTEVSCSLRWSCWRRRGMPAARAALLFAHLNHAPKLVGCRKGIALPPFPSRAME